MGSKDARKRRRRYARRVPKYRFERNLIKSLEKRLKGHAPEKGTDPAKAPPSKEDGGFVGAKLFSQLPISPTTLKGLDEAKYVEMTDVQRSVLPHGLVGRDILGAAKTGSGKTLVFLIIILEKLFRLQWSRMDGLGALIISPVRELALQIFEELKKVGKHHDFSGGLLIGGKQLDVEKPRISMMNILIGTPGRLLHHLDETVQFDVSNLQVLVLDEADRLLDMGFAKMLDAIIAHLPKQRQSLLFSATQTKSVKDLVRLSLNDPEYLAVHAEADVATPIHLKQFYVTCELHEKLTLLWSFIKTHSKDKIIAFVSTCTQVRFLYEALKKLLSNQHVCCLHGRIKQNKRTETFYRFCEAKSMVLLATDVAARGLDFPAVDWVLQVDAAETVSEYIHRVGRTARYTAKGRALLLIMPQEAHFLPKLEQRRIPIQSTKIKKTALTCPTVALQSLLTKLPSMKECAKKAIVTYLKSFTLNSSNSFEGLNIDAFAASYGLMTLPPSRALKKMMKKIRPPSNPSEKASVLERSNERLDSDEELFEINDAAKEDALDESCKPAPPTLLQELAETWSKEEDEMEEDLDVGVFEGPNERFQALKLGLQKRTGKDRAFVKAWKREATLKASSSNHPSNDANSMEEISADFSSSDRELEESETSDDEDSQKVTGNAKRKKII